MMTGNEALAEGAIAGGCRYFFGYPITPQNDIPKYMSEQLPGVGGTFVQAESELASINMVYGAAATGAYVMTSSSSPGISLMQEGLSYMLGSELPCVVVNMVRGGPGLGNIGPAQSDYWLATRGAGHGDGRCLTFAPSGVQELHDWGAKAFGIAQKYRCPVMVLGDAIIANMAEAITLRERQEPPPRTQDWAIGGHRKGRERRIVNSLWTDLDVMEQVNIRIHERFAQAAAEETCWDEYGDDDPVVAFAAYGISGRVCRTAVDMLAAEGIRARLIRPISLFPFPAKPIAEWAGRVERMISVELSMGQFIEDVRLAVEGRCPVALIWHAGGKPMNPDEVVTQTKQTLGQPA
jgi:2-oxoglutarate ferredoxin oxidoreductase subunit alpha